ncbi:MAG: hypothetical protein WAN61_02365 [Minisyncoccia bacterium]
MNERLSIKPDDGPTNSVFNRVDAYVANKEANPDWLRSGYGMLLRELVHANETKRQDLIDKVKAKITEFLKNTTEEDVKVWGESNWANNSHSNWMKGES